MSINININGNSFFVQSNISVLQACESVDIVIPRFCYHERLSVAGNCRMCLVEIDKMPKLQVSCSIPVGSNMSIKTDSPAVKKAREGVLEFLLINHPLDCPICDQGGECDLQDQSLSYGGDRSRFKEFKRAVEDKNCGPLIKTVMTRCIHCTRCVRFANEVVGVPDFGTSGRGSFLEIGTYINKMFSSELSGNVIDLCPVGALTSKPYAFLSRPWELKSIESIDVFDSIHSNIRIDTRGYDIMRVLPRLNELINEEWISDKARFSFDGLSVQRLTTPLIKTASGSFKAISWEHALSVIFNKMGGSTKPDSICFSVGDFCDLESLVFIKKISLILNARILGQAFEKYFDSDYQGLYKFNSTLKNISKADVCLLLGINPRIDGPILNYHIRKRFLAGKFVVGYIGSPLKLTFPTIHLGNSLSSFVSLAEGTNKFCKLLRKSANPLIIIGKSFQTYFKFFDLNVFTNIFKKSINLVSPLSSWCGLNFFNSRSSDFSFYELSLNQNSSYLLKKHFDLVYMVEDSKPLDVSVSSKFIIFQGHHGCFNAQKADMVIPSCSFAEKSSVFVSCEGRYQYSQSAVLPLGLSKKSSNILRVVLDSLKKNQDKSIFDSCIENYLPFHNYFINRVFVCLFFPSKNGYLYSFTQINNFYMRSSLFDNFYNTDIISGHSLNMSKCSKELLDKNPFIL